MNKMLLIALAFAGTAAFGQQASIKKVELAGEKVIVHYDLEASSPTSEFQIRLYASRDNFATPLTKVSGDVGNEIKAGPDKKIEWNIRDEFGPYKGKLALEIRGKMFVPVAKINSISAGDKLKRGQNHLVTWKPGNGNAVNIELLKNGTPVLSQANLPNNGSCSLFITPHTAAGKGYTLRITDTTDPENSTLSEPFTVSRKIPLVLKVVPVLVIGGVVAFLSGSDGGSPGGGRETDDGKIPLPGFPQ